MDETPEDPDREPTPEEEGHQTVRRRRWRRIRRVCYVTFGLVVGIPLITFWIAYLVLDVRSPQEVLAGLNKTVSVQYSDGSEVLKIVPPDGDRQFIPYAQIPEKLRDAIIATEDPTFWDNQGFDPTGIGRAFLTGYGGGSGITQQYIKKSTGDDDATIGRKLTELVLATKLTQQQSKEQIFESYVNIITFGRGTFGPAAAMNAFFGRPLDNNITWSQAAFLAGMIQSPSVHDPAASGDAHAAKRWQYVRDKLVSRGYVKSADAAKMAYPGNEIQSPSETRAGKLTYEQFHIKQRVLTELEQNGYPLSRLEQGDLTVVTTLDKGDQASAKQTLEGRLKGEPAELRGAVVAVEPGTGAIRAYEGGNDGVRDHAGTGKALGSAFYPFTLAAGLRAGRSPDEPARSPDQAEFLGEKFEFPQRCGADCTYRTAMNTQADTPFIDLAQQLGPDALSATARAAGIPDGVDGTPTMREQDGYLIGAGIAVGRYPLRPVDVAGAYATFADNGNQAAPYLVAKILDASGKVVWQHADTSHPAFDQDADRNAAIAGGVTSSLRSSLPDGRPAALRTGEAEHGNSADNEDAWAVGYTPQLATAVWIGTDDDRRLRDAKDQKIVGSTMPEDIWQSFMADAHRNLPFRPLAPARALVFPPRR